MGNGGGNLVTITDTIGELRVERAWETGRGEGLAKFTQMKKEPQIHTRTRVRRHTHTQEWILVAPRASVDACYTVE